MTKICTKCKKEKELDQFGNNKRHKDKKSCWCKRCTTTGIMKYNKARYHGTDPTYRTYCIAMAKEKLNPEQRRNNTLKRKFNITARQYDQILQIQNGVCKICSKINKNGRRLAVDHDHKTGKVRGLLCLHCNAILGYSKESIEILYNAIKYLKTVDIDRRVDK